MWIRVRAGLFAGKGVIEMEVRMAKMMRRKDVCAFLGVSRETVRRMVDEGVLDEVRLRKHGHPYYRRDDVERLVKG